MPLAVRLLIAAAAAFLLTARSAAASAQAQGPTLNTAEGLVDWIVKHGGQVWLPCRYPLHLMSLSIEQQD